MRLKLTEAQKKRVLKTPPYPNRLREAMKEAGVTQEQVAEWLGVTQVQVSRLVRGEHPRLPLATARRLSRLFQLRIDDLFPSRDEAVAS